MSGTLMLGCNDGDDGLDSVIGNAICDTDGDGGLLHDGGLLDDGGTAGPLTGGIDGGLVDAAVAPTMPVRPTTPLDVFIPLTEGQVVGVALAVHVGEVDGAKAALTRIVDPKVHAFAEAMVAAHEMAQGRLLAVGIAPEPSDKATEVQQASATATQLLTGLMDGAAFDGAYIQGQVNAHTRVRTLFDAVLRKNAVTPLLATELKAERDEAVMHLVDAQELIDGAPRTPVAPPSNNPGTGATTPGNTGGTTGGINTGTSGVAGGTGPALGGTAGTSGTSSGTGGINTGGPGFP